VRRQLLHRLVAQLAILHRAEGQLGNGCAITATAHSAQVVAVRSDRNQQTPLAAADGTERVLISPTRHLGSSITRKVETHIRETTASRCLNYAGSISP